MAQDLEAKQAVERGSEVSVDIAGTQIADLPDVEGETRDEAEQTLEEAGFEVEVETGESSAEYEGYVTGQDPQGGEGETAEVGSTVTITVGEGPAGSEPEAPNDRVPAGQTSKQRPPPSAEAKQNGPTNTVASPGPEQQPAPNVAGNNAAAGQQPAAAQQPANPLDPPLKPAVENEVENEVEDGGQGRGRGRGGD